MSFKLTLTAERQRRQAAEAEVTRLQAELAAITTNAATRDTLSHTTAPNVALNQAIIQGNQDTKQLEDQRDLARQVIDISPNIVYVEDESGRCILANRSYVQLLSQLADESQASAAPELSGTNSPRLSATATSFEESYRLKDEQTVWYCTNKIPLVRNDGTRFLVTFSSNVTELKEAQRVAEESMQARQIFLANMSHEIRTPLHGVMGLTELLKKEPLSEEQADYVEMIQSSTENLLVVLNDILDFAKIEAGQIRLEHIPFDVLKTVQDAARSLSFKMNEKGLLLRIEGLDQNLPLALGDPFRLYQVLVNLLSNAIKFTPKGIITITIDASKRAGLSLPITFSVADTGIGISADNLDQVFDSFQQANNSIPRLYGGTGLGLTICKNLVELQGGEIGVHSEVSQGSCFFFTIPYAVSEEPLVKESNVIQQPDLLQGLSILLVEDNPINQLIAVSMLSQWQIKVNMAQNGEEALIKAFQYKFDLILMDIQMPQLDGIAATARLRAQTGLNQHTPIIALTADAIQVGADSFQGLGFTDYLIKPYHEVALYRMLTQISQRPLPAPPAAPTPQGPHYDFSMFGKLASDPEFIRKLLGMFLEQVPGQVHALQVAIEHENWQEVAQKAHILKTTFGNLNIEPETTHLKRLEKLAEQPASKSQLQPLIESVANATQVYTALFLEELTHTLQDLQ
jgi:signal transduction histidine kinase/DNA-binding response OmpR family regulator